LFVIVLGFDSNLDVRPAGEIPSRSSYRRKPESNVILALLAPGELLACCEKSQIKMDASSAAGRPVLSLSKGWHDEQLRAHRNHSRCH
jgi:hypothetical protein